jgi:hypothetical protein
MTGSTTTWSRVCTSLIHHLSNVVPVKPLSTYQPNEMTFNYSPNSNFTNQTLSLACDTSPFPIPTDGSNNTKYVHRYSPSVSFESAPVHSNNAIPQWPIDPFPLTDSNLFPRSAYNQHVSQTQDLSAFFYCKVGSSFADIHFRVVQNWQPINPRISISPSETQHSDDTFPIGSLTSILTPPHPPPPRPTSSVPTSHTPPAKVIGTISYQAESDNYIFKCSIPRCKHKTFTRWYDLRRHHDSTHSNDGPAFWCHVNGCERSETPGGRSFPRKDKLGDHVRKAHRGDERVLEIKMLRTRGI